MNLYYPTVVTFKLGVLTKRIWCVLNLHSTSISCIIRWHSSKIPYYRGTTMAECRRRVPACLFPKTAVLGFQSSAPQQFHLFSIWFILSGYLCRVSFCPWVGEISPSVPWSVQRDTSDLHLIVLNWAPVAAVHMHAILMILLLYYPRLLIWLVQFAASYFWFFVGFSISAFWGCPLQLNIPDKLPLRIMMKSFCHFLKCSSEKSLLLTKF